MKRIAIVTLFVSVFVFYSCGLQVQTQKVDQYLYLVEYSDYDFEKLAKFADRLLYGKKKMPSAPACSAIRCDSLFGRNFDWYYDEMPEFVMYTKAKEGRYASLGVASPISILKDKQVNGLWGKFILGKLPAFTVDGINEKGVACCINVVPQCDCGATVGTNPGKPELYSALFVRYVLDNASSAREAIALLDDRNIYTSVAFGLREDYHFLIADSTSTYVVEFVNNQPVVLEGRHYMTNFHLSAGVTPHAMGLERYEIIGNGYENAASMEGMLNLLKSVWYSNFYKEKDHPWMSELCSDLEKYGLTTEDISSSPRKFEKPLDEERAKYRNRNRKRPDTWHSVHTSIYNLYDKTLIVNNQEGDFSHCFRFNQ